MSNHLIIGLGGTGGKIIYAFRKILFQQFRDKINKDDSERNTLERVLQSEEVNIAYLYVDSDEQIMPLEDPNWKILGESVHPGLDSQLHLKGADLKYRIDNKNDFPGIRDWIGNQNDWNDIIRSFAGGKVYGQQKRRLGRFLLACNIDSFANKLESRVRTLREISGQPNVTFHVCCGLAGGTGSGCVIDTITQIRKRYPYDDSQNYYRIIAYTLLPEENPLPHWDTGNYQANGYAALMELNALDAGRFDPCDIHEGGIVSNDIKFNGLYLFTNQNGHVVVDVDNAVPQIIADFLYQKIVAIRNNPWNDLNRAENAENGDCTPETAPLPGSQIPERGKRFLTFGINQVAIPEQEIKEYLAYSFAYNLPFG